MINSAMNVSAYRRRATDDKSSTASALGGMPLANQRFARARSGVAEAGNTLKHVQLGLTIGGGVFVALGVGAAFAFGVGTGSSLAVTGRS